MSNEQSRRERSLARKQSLRLLTDKIIEEFGDLAEVWQQRPYTGVKLVVIVNDAVFTGIGFSKVMKPDKWNANEGRARALFKAARRIASQILQYERKEDEPETDSD